MRSELKKFMEENSVSSHAVARATGISYTTISLWLNGKYKGKVDKINDAVNNFLLREYERKDICRTEFIQTKVVDNVFDVAKMCHINSEIGVCIGRAGLGKTVTVREYAKLNTDVILIEADLGYTPKILFGELHKRLGFEGIGNIYSMMLDIVKKLKNSNRLIIVDEAEHLPYKALELLRRIYDKAGVGIMLVGMPRLLGNLRGKTGQYEQLYSRIGVLKELKPLDLTDIRKIILRTLPDALDLSDKFLEESLGNTRVLSKLIVKADKAAKLSDSPIDEEIIQEVSKHLLRWYDEN
ncbi:MAG: AAA family ATPase [Candidatus Gastranaerophilales bacterium]|nr:AAA family ATPase [Candidatus Gastranaerophilales bacterium]